MRMLLKTYVLPLTGNEWNMRMLLKTYVLPLTGNKWNMRMLLHLVRQLTFSSAQSRGLLILHADMPTEIWAISLRSKNASVYVFNMCTCSVCVRVAYVYVLRVWTCCVYVYISYPCEIMLISCLPLQVCELPWPVTSVYVAMAHYQCVRYHGPSPVCALPCQAFTIVGYQRTFYHARPMTSVRVTMQDLWPVYALSCKTCDQRTRYHARPVTSVRVTMQDLWPAYALPCKNCDQRTRYHARRVTLRIFL